MAEPRWAYSDESERSSTMLMTVVVLDAAMAGEVRSAMRGLLLPGQRRVHMAKEGRRRQRAIVDVVVALDGVDVSTTRLRRTAGVDRVHARRHLVEHVLGRLLAQDVGAWTLEDVPPSQRVRDKEAIGLRLQQLEAADRLVYDHRRGQDEPLLWIPDVIGWAVGAGVDWRRRIARAVTIEDIDP